MRVSRKFVYSMGSDVDKTRFGGLVRARTPQTTWTHACQRDRLRLFDGSTTATAPAKTVRACAGNRASA